MECMVVGQYSIRKGSASATQSSLLVSRKMHFPSLQQLLNLC